MAIVLARENGAADGDDIDADIASGALHDVLAATQRRRRKKIAAAGKRFLIIIAAADADQLIDLIVVGRDVFVADGPWNLPAVALGSGEIEIAVAQGYTAPDVGFTAASPDAGESEVLAERSDVGLL